MLDRDLVAEITILRSELSELRWRMQNMVRPAIASDVDNDRGLVRLDVGGVKTGWTNVFEQGGSVSTFSPTSKGEVLMALAPFGDIRETFALRGGFSGPNPKATDRGDEAVVNYGTSRHFLRPDAAGLLSSSVELGAIGGEQVARVGDLVHVKSGSSAGYWPIVTGSQIVRAG